MRNHFLSVINNSPHSFEFCLKMTFQTVYTFYASKIFLLRKSFTHYRWHVYDEIHCINQCKSEQVSNRKKCVSVVARLYQNNYKLNQSKCISRINILVIKHKYQIKKYYKGVVITFDKYLCESFRRIECAYVEMLEILRN